MKQTSDNRGRILVVEDDRKTASLVTMYLQNNGYEVVQAYDGCQALEVAREQSPVLVILDLMLPVKDGWEVCTALRKDSDVPVIMLTARGDEDDRIEGLNMGADDYVVKPFSPRELVARVEAVLRRRERGEAPAGGELISGELTLDQERKIVTCGGRRLSLTPHEFRLLQTLMSRPGKVFSRRELLKRLYPDGDVVVIDRVVDVHIGKLRQKVEKDPAEPRHILTVRGMGYQLAEEGEE